MPSTLVTGFPGFLAAALLPKLLDRTDGETSVACLIQSRYLKLAQERAAEITRTRPEWKSRLQLIEGDITLPGLGLSSDALPLRHDVREAFHLAAVYDLAVSRPLGQKINVEGTVNVLDFLAGCGRFDRLHYVSTCYVSGRHPGPFTERDLDVGQRFNNYYEETKYLAEGEVQKRMQRGLCATIYRPAIVVGDSRTGETQKYDGPYYAMQWVLRWKSTVPTVVVGDCRKFRVNIVPRDFVIGAIGELSGAETSRGQVYQLCDPHPLTVAELYDVLGRASHRRVVKIRLPGRVAKGSMKYIPGLSGWLRILPETLDYFTHPTEYTCDNTLRDLAGSGIKCPPFVDYASTLIHFMQDHPEIGPQGLH